MPATRSRRRSATRGAPATRPPSPRRSTTALQRPGFLLVTGHGVDAGAAAAVRAAARRFFALPAGSKQRYAARIGGRGWLAPGVEANGLRRRARRPRRTSRSRSPSGPTTPTGDPAIDAVWFPPNVWPAEVPELRAVVTRYLARCAASPTTCWSCARAALGLPADTLTSLATQPDLDVQHQPLSAADRGRASRSRGSSGSGRTPTSARSPCSTASRARAGCRCSYEPRRGRAGQDAPYDPDALTVNIGDLLAHWTGLRWRSGRHRVLPPQAAHPDEELMSLVFFYELDHDAVVTPLAPPVGGGPGWTPW